MRKRLGPITLCRVGAEQFSSLYKEEARYADTEPLYKRALAIREKRWGSIDV